MFLPMLIKNTLIHLHLTHTHMVSNEQCKRPTQQQTTNITMIEKEMMEKVNAIIMHVRECRYCFRQPTTTIKKKRFRRSDDTN